MPRTKLPKNPSKRVRDVDAETLMDTKRKEFDSRVEFIFDEANHRIMDKFLKLQKTVEDAVAKMPIELQNMTLAELQALNLPTFEEIKQSIKCDANATASILMMSARAGKRDDEGYLTEGSCSSSQTTRKRSTAVQNNVPMGPLSSARARSRRSKSASSTLQTPSVIMSIKSKRTPLVKQAPVKQHSLDDSTASSTRMSRSKYRTPTCRSKAASADRIGMITPKVQMGTPVAILRYPRLGESILSMSGSPVAAMPAPTDVANIAIPCGDGVISVRPTSMGEFDSNLLNRIDSATLLQLKKLQDNLNKVIKNIDGKF